MGGATCTQQPILVATLKTSKNDRDRRQGYNNVDNAQRSSYMVLTDAQMTELLLCHQSAMAGPKARERSPLARGTAGQPLASLGCCLHLHQVLRAQ